MATRPKVRAFLLCDAAVTDGATGKTTLVGIFDQVVATSYPVIWSSFAVYFKVTDLNGSYGFEVVFVAPDLATVVGRLPFPGRIVADNPLVPFENTGNVLGLTLPAAGRYTVRLMYNGVVADEFSVEATEQP
jgi:hypothetical protein